jgi:spermidine/putrescine transport system permease protein
MTAAALPARLGAASGAAAGGRSPLVTAALLAPASLFLFFLLVLPLAVVVIYSFGERAPAGGYAPAFTFENYLNLASRGKAILNTLTIAPLATLITAIVAFPMAYYLAVKVPPRWRLTLLVLVMAPFWTSQLLRYYAWMMILGSQGLPSWLAAIGIEGVRIINTPTAVIIGAVYGYLPLMVPPIYVSLEKLDRRLLDAAADLGATPWGTFRQVTLPLALPGIATGSMLVFILLMGDYILPQFLGGGKVFFIGNALVDLFLQSRNWPFGAALSLTLVAIMFVTIFAYMRFILNRSGVRQDVVV